MSHSNDSAAALRIREVLDKNSFVELGAYVTARSTDFNLAEQDTPGDGVVTGYGTIEDRLVYIYSQDPAVLGGSVGEMHAKKIKKLYDLAVKMEAPVIGLIDCSGLRLQEATDSLNALGELYRCQTLASGVVPQIQAIYGTCGGSLAVSASIADFTFMEKEHGRLFMHAANALSHKEEASDTASPEFQSAESGVADFVGTAAEIAEGIRSLVSILPASFEDDPSYDECQDSLNRLVPEAEGADADALLKAISDEGFVCEPGREYGSCVKTAFIRLNGCTVGTVAALSEELCANGIEKAGKFVRFCDAFSIPLLTLVDASGLEKSVASERQMAKKAAALIAAYAGATVPKVTVVTGKAYGLIYNLFAPKASADIVYAWENAEIGLMNAGDAVKVIYAAELDKAEDKTALYNEKTAAYAALQNGAVSAARRGYVDDIIAPQLTRKRVIAAFEMLFTKNEDVPAKKHGTV